MGDLIFLSSPFVKDSYQSFDHGTANVNSGLLSVVVLSIVTPAAFAVTQTDMERILGVSRSIAVILLLTYVIFLLFQLYTNVCTFDIY